MTSRSEVDASPVHPGDMRAQLRQCCENIGRALRAVGGDYGDVVETTTFTTDVEEYHRVSDERAKYLKSDLPTSALIGVVRLAHPNLMVEIEAWQSFRQSASNLRNSRSEAGHFCRNSILGARRAVTHDSERLSLFSFDLELLNP